MPYYFAIPRSGNQGSQRRQDTGRVDYVRTAATSLTHVSEVAKTRIQLNAVENLAALVLSAQKGKKEGKFSAAFYDNCTPRRMFESVADLKLPGLNMPQLSLRFKQLTEAQEDTLRGMGFEERTIKKKGKVWTGTLSGDMTETLESFDPIGDAEAVGGTLSMRGLAAMNQIVRIIALAGEALDLACDKVGGDNPAFCTIDYNKGTLKRKCTQYSTRTLGKIAEESELATNPSTTELMTSFVALRQRRPVFGNTFDTVFRPQGVFLPFEPNYSATDKRAIHVLLSEFHSLCSEPGDLNMFDRDLVELWVKEISLTMEGEFLAHMIATLVLAKKIMAMPYFIVVNGIYEGAVLHGAETFTFKQVGGPMVSSLGQAGLAGDIQRYSFHSTTVKTIVKEAGLGPDIHPDNIKSMRQLRTVVMGRKEFAITPTLRATLEKSLLFLNFREKPEGVNPHSISKFMSYIHPTAPAAIPDDVYLDRRCFFSTSRTEIALSMFGLYAPSPQSGGISMVLATPPASQKGISAKPAAVQFSFKELSVAAREWDTVAENGKVSMSLNRIKRGARFTGNDRDEIWGLLQKYAAAGLSKNRSEGSAAKMDLGSEKRKRDGDDSGSPEIGRLVKKPSTSLSALFADSMES